MDMVKVEALAKWIRESKNIVAFTGAGCSTESGVPDFRSPGGVFDLGTNCPITTESGIPDFRSVDGLYRQQYAFPPETILSHSFFERNPEEFYRFYRSKMLFPQARPNAAHWKLAELEAAGKLTAVVTQNIDGLHQAAGSKTVYELHGSVHRNHCMKCRRFYGLDFLLETGGVPRCPACGEARRGALRGVPGRDNHGGRGGGHRRGGHADHRRYLSGGVPGGGADPLLPRE